MNENARTSQEDRSEWLRADFNGLFDGILCVSHTDFATRGDGNAVRLIEGMDVTVFEEDTGPDGARDDLTASGIIERAPEWLTNHGSRWVLRIDADGVAHESDRR